MAKGAQGVTRPSASSVSVIARRLSPDPEWNARPADGLAAGRGHGPGRWGWHPSPADSAVHPPLGRAGVLAGIHGPIEVVAQICGVPGFVPDVPVHVPVAVGAVCDEQQHSEVYNNSRRTHRKAGSTLIFTGYVTISPG